MKLGYAPGLHHYPPEAGPYESAGARTLPVHCSMQTYHLQGSSALADCQAGVVNDARRSTNVQAACIPTSQILHALFLEACNRLLFGCQAFIVLAKASINKGISLAKLSVLDQQRLVPLQQPCARVL